MSFLEGKLNSIAEAAASGFLKVPEIKEPVNVEQTSKQTGPGMSIADAAKTGLLKVPTAGEKKGQRPISYWLTSYVINVNKYSWTLSHRAVLTDCWKVIGFYIVALHNWL